MIKEIDGLKFPNIINSEITYADNSQTRNTVSNRLITRQGFLKYEIIVNFNETLLSLDFQREFYSKCLKAKGQTIDCVIVDPLTNEDKLLRVKCLEIYTPTIKNIVKRMPTLYEGVGAKFREV